MAPIWKPIDNLTLKLWLETIEHEAQDKLTEWEMNFVDSVSYQIKSGHTLSQKQEKIFERIYSEKTD